MVWSGFAFLEKFLKYRPYNHSKTCPHTDLELCIYQKHINAYSTCVKHTGTWRLANQNRGHLYKAVLKVQKQKQPV